MHDFPIDGAVTFGSQFTKHLLLETGWSEKDVASHTIDVSNIPGAEQAATYVVGLWRDLRPRVGLRTESQEMLNRVAVAAEGNRDICHIFAPPRDVDRGRTS